MKRVAVKPSERLTREIIEGIERKELRALRELLLDPSNAEARKRLEDIDAKISALRASPPTDAA